jgi:uncharacterized membrane protein
MANFHPKTPLDKAFEISLLLKGLDGLLETVGGVVFLFIHPEHIVSIANRLTAHNQHSFWGRHLLSWAHGFTKGAAIFAALYLLSHGLIKLVLVVAILKEHLWAYPALIVTTFGFVVYQLYHIVADGPTFSYVLLTLFDVVVIYLTTKEYGKQKEHFAKRHASVVEEQ